MRSDSARDILLQLLAGIHPVTGEILPEDDVFCEPLVQQALSMAAEALTLKTPEEGTLWLRKNGKLHAGRPWTDADNQVLLQLAARGVALEEIARLTSRRTRGVSHQLDLLRGSKKHPNKAWRAWTAEDDERLRNMYREDYLITHMAKALERSEFAIACRLEKLELVPEGTYVRRNE